MDVLEVAAEAIARADSLVVTAGAGMGVDSGLPDFRGRDGFWRAYPPLAKLGLSFAEIANPRWFERDPELAWGFYGHRLDLYRRTRPHAGFSALLRGVLGKRRGGFVFTSNVDGHFQKAGFEEGAIVECHGSIHHLQCTRNCSEDIWPASITMELRVEGATCRAKGELPRCRNCGALARPNILMFGDGAWQEQRTGMQEAAFAGWLKSHDLTRVAVIEVGAGTTIATVRRMSEGLQEHGATLVRINSREAEGPPGTISVPLGAMEALARISAKATDPTSSD